MGNEKKSGVISRFIGEFKEFISKGSVLDMAVGVIVGGAFTSIINSLVDDILMPVIGTILLGVNFKSLGFHIPWGNEPYINLGGFLTAVITFLLTALCVFIFVKVVNTIRNFHKKPEPPKEEKPAEVPDDIKLLTEIRDLLIQQKNSGEK
ncbi:large conductance mechanosensitive channel protein MscL [Ruminococcus sp. Marseille-P6503]|uniref:large conductance mechanosensitive channel protein MscL n=1 Tax=Ruminococcus sp. Marseille-P6503 TaxID=2364796 RepID=UPI0019CF5BF7|nr:large conductance mechanosensitive channel protein MscL [Ruminococcus sp. Marseille-P6503]